MNEFKDQLDAAEKEKVTKHVTELREIAAKGQAGDAAVTAEAIREKINEAQQASLSLFQKVGNRSLAVVYHPDAIILFRSMRRRTLRTRHLPLQRKIRRRRKRRRIKLLHVPCCLSLCCYLMTSHDLYPLLDPPKVHRLSTPLSTLACLLYSRIFVLSPFTHSPLSRTFYPRTCCFLSLYPSRTVLVVGIQKARRNLWFDLSKRSMTCIKLDPRVELTTYLDFTKVLYPS